MNCLQHWLISVWRLKDVSAYMFPHIKSLGEGVWTDVDGPRKLTKPYRGNAPALTDLLAAQVQLGFESMPSSIQYIQVGRAAGAWRQHHDAFAGAAGCADRQRVRARLRVGARSTASACPAARLLGIIQTLNREINEALADPHMKARFADLGGMPLAGLARRFRHTHRRRDREMVQGNSAQRTSSRTRVHGSPGPAEGRRHEGSVLIWTFGPPIPRLTRAHRSHPRPRPA